MNKLKRDPKFRNAVILIVVLMTSVFVLGNGTTQTVISEYSDLEEMVACPSSASCCPDGTSFYKTSSDAYIVNNIVSQTSGNMFTYLISFLPSQTIIRQFVDAFTIRVRELDRFPSGKICCEGLDKESTTFNVDGLIYDYQDNGEFVNLLSYVKSFLQDMFTPEKQTVDLVTCEYVPFGGALCFDFYKDVGFFDSLNCSQLTYVTIGIIILLGIAVLLVI